MQLCFDDDDGDKYYKNKWTGEETSIRPLFTSEWGTGKDKEIFDPFGEDTRAKSRRMTKWSDYQKTRGLESDNKDAGRIDEEVCESFLLQIQY